jgi:hypothetical protein
MTPSCVLRKSRLAPLARQRYFLGPSYRWRVGMRARLAAALAMAAIAWTCLAGEAKQVTVFHEAKFVLSDTVSPPGGDAAPWRSVTLPQQWRSMVPGTMSRGSHGRR